MTAITPLDLAWEAINALGGTFDQNNAAEVGYNLAISNALSEIEKLGGGDPAARRYAARNNVISIGDHSPEYLRTIGVVAAEMAVPA